MRTMLWRKEKSRPPCSLFSQFGSKWLCKTPHKRTLLPFHTASIVSSANKIIENVSQEDLFSYNAQRWIWNEHNQLKRRYVKFDLKSLIRATEEAVGEGASCIEVSKLPEGNFNKTFLMTMQTGLQVIARIPNPNAGRPHYTTASEVATMDYIGNKLQLPIPKVLAYDLDAGSNSVGSEYIIMEKCPGIELARVWEDLPGKQKVIIVGQLAVWQARLSKARFPSFGALYYSKDIPAAEKVEVDETFSVGPTVGRSWFDDRRGELDIFRGPWKSMEEFILALSKRELACLEAFSEFPRDRQQGIFNGPGGYHPNKDLKTSVLRDFERIMPHLITRNEAHSASILWHNDLHGENIFVDKNDPTKITGIIDWQGVHLAPVCMTVDHPSLIDYDGPILKQLEKPELPSNFDELDHDAQKSARALHTAQSVRAIYEVDLWKKAPEIPRAILYRNTLQCQLLNLIGSIFDDGEIYVQNLLAQATEPDTWKKINELNGLDPNVLCPLAYSEDEVAWQLAEREKWALDVDRRDRVIADIGVYDGWEGAVPTDQYDYFLEWVQQAKEKFLDAEAKTPEERKLWEMAWPFEDK